MHPDARFSPACERNREPILSVLRDILADRRRVLEIGSGTGQHGAYFAPELPHLTWQPSDLPDNHPSIRAWREHAGVPNLAEPLVVDLLDDLPDTVKRDTLPCDTIYSANVAHIVRWEGVENMIRLAGRVLPDGGIFILYGPFRYSDRPLEPSNAAFHESLGLRIPGAGIRDFDDVARVAAASSLTLVEDRAMPANNRMIWWRR